MTTQVFSTELDLQAVEAGSLKLLDPSTVFPSRWVCRRPDTYLCAGYESLKGDIAGSGGNVQAIRVRPLQTGFEIIFGHRRHRACLELGLPVLAIVSSVSDLASWTLMTRENRHRDDLSPYEQGMHYKSALDGGLFESIRHLASHVGVDFSQAAKVLKIAALPTSVIGAFESPHDIQVNWATALHRAIEKCPDEVTRRAHALRAASPRKSAGTVFDCLTEEPGVEPFHALAFEIVDEDGHSFAKFKRERTRYVIQLRAQGVSPQHLEAALRTLMAACQDS